MDNIIIILLHFMIYMTKGETDYQISIPEFICDKSRDLTDSKNSKTVIGLSGQGKLDFKLNFERIGDTFGNNQRCNLIIWKVVRDFEKYLNNYPYAQTNDIVFNNSMLLPGLRYIFNIYVTIGENAVKQKQFSLDFVDGTTADSTKKVFATLSLIGATSVEAHMTYVLNAKIDICSNNLEYYIKWELLDNTRNILETFADRGPELTIPSFTFQSGKQYFVKCNLIKVEDDEILTSEFQFIEVKDNMNSLIVKLPMLYTTMKVQQAINIKPYIIDLGNHDGEVKIEWSCRLNNKNFCENKNDDFLNIEGGFLEEGEYNISIRVSKGSMKKSDTCKIKIMNDVPSIEIDTIEYPILPSSGAHIRANIDDLRTFCTLQWKSTDSNFLLDLNQVPGNVNELRQVIVKRDLFLKELEEFSNDVSNKEHDLLIPPPTENWAGFPAEDWNYKLHFTLEAKCPKVQLQDDADIEYSGSILNDTIMVFALVEIDVNVPPKIQPLTVEPSTGVALETVFTFQTLEAVETGTRSPFLYKFGYLLEDREYVFCNMLEYTKCETVLPHTDKSIKTFLEVCDSFNSCAKLFGPVVNILLPDQINETKVLKIYKEKMNSEDFQKAFGYALTILYTSKALQEEDKYTEYFSREVSNKIQYLLKHYNTEANWAKRANKLIKYLSDFNKELSFNDKVINGLVELRTKLLSDHKENLAVPRRKLLATEKLLTDLENFKSYLEVSDIIITSSKDKNRVESEKEHLRRIIKQYMGKLCTELYQTGERVSLVLKSVILVVEELPKKSYGNFHTIPYKENPWNTTAVIKLNLEDMTKMKNEKLCIAKFVYKNILNKTGIIYEADVLNANDGNIVLKDTKNTVLIPFDTGEIKNKVAKCLVYRNEWQTKCEFIKNISQYAQCFCSIMGSYYLEYEDKKVSVTELQSNTTNFPSTRAQLGDGYTENEILTVKTSPSTYEQNTIQFDTTTKSVQNVNNVPHSTIESRLFEDTNSEDITDTNKFSTSPITEIVEAITALPDFDNGGSSATSNSNAEKTSSSYEEDNTGTESVLLTNNSVSTFTTNSYTETNTTILTYTVTSTVVNNVTTIDDSISATSISTSSNGTHNFASDKAVSYSTLPLDSNTELDFSTTSTTTKHILDNSTDVNSNTNKDISDTEGNSTEQSNKGTIYLPFSFTKTNTNKKQMPNSIGHISADIASYVLIASSLLGMGVLYYILRKLSVTSVGVDTDDVETPKYAKLHDEFLLN